MIGDGLTAFLCGVGASIWFYGRLTKTTNNTKSSVIGGAFAGVLVFVVVLILLKYVLHY